MAITAERIKQLARECGFELVGIAAALPIDDFERFESWRTGGMAGEMTYLTDRRGDMRRDPRNLLASARSILCVGKLYNTPFLHSTELSDPGRGWISRYAWGGADYHDVMRRDLEQLVQRITEVHGEPFDWKICVDTTPLLERSYARAAGLGWIGKNTCLINQEKGSWFFLGELLLSIPLAPDAPPPERCGTCTRCIEACPTQAIVPRADGGWELDARLCISYLTIEKRGELPGESHEKIGNHVFGCDICQDVCPWNSRAPVSGDAAFAPAEVAPVLSTLAALSESEFREKFRKTPVWRAKYAGFLRNVAIALKNTVAALVLAGLLCSTLRASIDLQDPATVPGWVDFYNNDYNGALAYFEQQVKAHPDDPQAYNHVAESILYRQLFRDGALESELASGNSPFLKRAKLDMPSAARQHFLDSIDKAEALSKAALAKNPKDVSALYSLGVSHGLRANYSFLIEKRTVESLREASATRNIDEDILRLDPKFVDARLALGLDQYIVGCLPFYLRVIGSIGGFHGDKQAGIQQLELVRREGTLNRYDAAVMLAVIYRREHQPEKAIPLLEELSQRFPRNYLFLLEQVQMYSDAGDKHKALGVLAHLEEMRRARAPGFTDIPEAKIDYLKGNLLFWYGDLDAALPSLKQATKAADELDLNTAVLAWLRLGQVQDLKGDHRGAIAAYREAMKTAPNSGAAEEAKAYISNPYRGKRAAG